MNAYSLVIALSCVIIFSHVFNVFSKKTNVPSVILLILLGVGVEFVLKLYDLSVSAFVKESIEVIGIVGLIMIVLEGAMDLELTREKWPTIWKSFLVALLSLMACAFIISFIINQYYHEDPIVSLVYAIPLSIMSSAIVIPSVGRLIESKKEFMIYESTFSDILGIMFFYFLKDNVGAESANTVVYSIIGNIVITIVVSFVVSYALVMLFQRLTGDVKFFLLIAVLMLLYAIGKQMHLSSLVIILVFGLLINNCNLFFFGKLKSWVDQKAVDDILKNLHLVTKESAFVIRTFFFVMFGASLDLAGLIDFELWGIGLLIVAVFFITRYLFLKLFYWKGSILPELFITPRGLITVLLFFSIPASLESESFNQDIILVTIIVTSVIMTWGLIKYGKSEEDLEVEPEKLADLDVPGGKEVSYFVQRMSEDYEEEEEPEKPATEPEAESNDEENKEMGNPTAD
ncbi:MAG: sodium:proton exchanger [Roseivirga sp.]|nr:sodium:proton exchanger [Roseivirga sp.]